MLQSIYTRFAIALTDLPSRARREEGQALVEYALIISLIAVVAIGALQLTGTRVSTILQSIADNL